MSTVDAAQLAAQFASFEIQPYQVRYGTQLSEVSSERTAYNSLKSALQSLDDTIYDLNSFTGSVKKYSTSVSDESILSLSSDNESNNINTNIFVEQLAQNHQMIVSTAATDPSDIFGTTGTVSVDIDGNNYTVDLALADANEDGFTSYQEFIDVFNDEAGEHVNATLVRSEGSLNFLFSSNETGEEQQFTITATGTSLDTEFSDANLSPLNTARDAIVWLGDQTSGVKLTNSTNTFEEIFTGVSLTIKKAQTTGETPVGVSIQEDVDATKSVIQSLISEVNNVISTIDKYSEIDEEGINSGALASSSIARGVTTRINNLLRTEFAGVTGTELGINLNESGQFSIDSDTLDEAFNNIDIDEYFRGENNLLDGLEGILDSYLSADSGAVTNKISTLDSQSERINDNLSALEARYESYYQKYLQEFNYLNQIYAEMDSINSMFSQF